MRMGMIVAAALLALPATPAASATPELSIERLRAHLFYAGSGTLSEDLIARPEPFVGWNTVIGEGDAAEPASDLLVVVEVATAGEQFSPDTLEIWILDGDGYELARRSIEGLLTTEGGKGAFALYANDVACGGALSIHARYKGEHETAQLQLFCGE